MVLTPPLAVDAIDEFIGDDQIKPANVSFSKANSNFTTFFRRFTPEQLNAFNETLGNLRDSFNHRLINNEEPGEIEKKIYGKKFVSIHRREMTPLPAKVPSHGQCIIGLKSFLVNTAGSFNFCTQVSDVYNLGNIEMGFDLKRIEKFYFDLDEFFAGKCYGCWAIRFCMKCVKELNRNGELDEALLDRFCVKKRAAVLNEIKDYIKIREANYHALDYLAEIDIWE